MTTNNLVRSFTLHHKYLTSLYPGGDAKHCYCFCCCLLLILPDAAAAVVLLMMMMMITIVFVPSMRFATFLVFLFFLPRMTVDLRLTYDSLSVLWLRRGMHIIIRRWKWFDGTTAVTCGISATGSPKSRKYVRTSIRTYVRTCVAPPPCVSLRRGKYGLGGGGG